MAPLPQLPRNPNHLPSDHPLHHTPEKGKKTLFRLITQTSFGINGHLICSKEVLVGYAKGMSDNWQEDNVRSSGFSFKP